MSNLFGSLFGASSAKGDAMNESAINAAASDYEKKMTALSMSTYEASLQAMQAQSAMQASKSQAAMQAAYNTGLGGVWLDANGNLQSGYNPNKAGHLYRSAHPSDVYGGFSDAEIPSYIDGKDTTCVDFDQDAIIKNEIGTLDMVEVFGGKYSSNNTAQTIYLGGVPSLCTISYEVPSRIKFSGAVAASGAIDQYMTSIRLCTKLKGRLSAISQDIFMMSKYVEWTVCKVDDGVLEISSSISNMSSLMAAICQVNIKSAHT